MAKSIGTALGDIRALSGIPLELMAAHAHQHLQWEPAEITSFHSPGQSDHAKYVQWLDAIEDMPTPKPDMIIWHAALRLCMSNPKGYPHLYEREQWSQPYNDGDDVRLLRVVRTRKIGARWWWRINRFPRLPGAWCLICDVPIRASGRLEHGDPRNIGRVLMHRDRHLDQLAQNPPWRDWRQPEKWRTLPFDSGRRS